MKKTKNYAMILTAYNDFDVLLKCLTYYTEYCDVYIHIDKKTSPEPSFYDDIKKFPNVLVISKRKVNYGGATHVSAMVDLLKIASANHYIRYHILSANTFPMKLLDEMEQNLQTDKNYIEVLSAESENLIDRQTLFHFWNLYDMKTKRGNTIEYRMEKLQQKIGIHRKIRYEYKGHFYCHLNDMFVHYVLGYVKNNAISFLKLKTVKIPEEFFFQNIIMTSPYQETVVNDCLIYSDWESGRGGHPATLEFNDIEKLLDDNYMFARKIRDVRLIERIIKEITVKKKEPVRKNCCHENENENCTGKST